MTYGETIRAARVAKRMTLRALARALNVSAPYISDVEHDRRTLSSENELKTVELLGLDPVLLVASKGYTRELADWLKANPDWVAFLRDIRRREAVTGHPIRIGGEDCPCRRCR